MNWFTVKKLGIILPEGGAVGFFNHGTDEAEHFVTILHLNNYNTVLQIWQRNIPVSSSVHTTSLISHLFKFYQNIWENGANSKSVLW